MSKKHYEAVAAILRDRRHLHMRASADTVDAITYDLCDVFAADNPLFDRSRFLKACGVKDES